MTNQLDVKTETLKQTLSSVAENYAPAAFSSSLSSEDMVLTDSILINRLNIEIFAINTGRLHRDTLDLVDAVADRYRYQVRIFTPAAEAISQFTTKHGRDAFYDSIEQRHECCRIRKVEPLKRALHGKKAWITGLRREHSVGRVAIPEREFDTSYDLLKVNPLVDWSEQDVWDYVHTRGVPFNNLYDQGYRSIGCAPCTRPVVNGEDIRAGRWWWEKETDKECGLHVANDGRLVRVREIA